SSAFVRRCLGKANKASPVRLQCMARKAPLSFAQQRLWFLAQLEPRSPAYNILSAIQIEGPLDTAALERSLTEMSRRHETLRTTFVVEDATPVQIIHPLTLYGAFIQGRPSPLSELQQLRAEGEEVPLLFMLDPSEERLEPPGKVKETGLFRLLWSRVQRHLRKLALLGSGAYFNAASGVPLVNFRT